MAEALREKEKGEKDKIETSDKKTTETKGGEQEEGSLTKPVVSKWSILNPRFVWGGGKCKRRNFIGRVTISECFRVSFDLKVHGQHGNHWASILHIGAVDGERIPGVWFHPGTLQLHVRVSDIEDGNRGYDPNSLCEIGETYHIEVESLKDGTVTFKLNGKVITTRGDVVVLTKFQAPIFAGDPWFVHAFFF
ncbi:hypothetical protein RFI_30622 [Reticulomyxa filosa]|uniref:Uncharacterized protein n=1 Tax=Reticulomyxa filosa TaxID=46433 RepID=X6LXV7_RETFI|nr:hypothetical protein RFI_30622 [Reticulomyxa filosa]|eukprot:ETO06768.1 hypothetical protein RFI_30622 [Reticulomyxa filosa]